jgi:homoserine O-acetyltransferase
MRYRLVFTVVLGLAAAGLAGAQTPSTWATKDGTFTISDFRFGTGETLPQLRLHYLTLGKPHTDKNGHTDNAVLLLHGTGGDAHSLLNPIFSDVLFGPGQPLDNTS